VFLDHTSEAYGLHVTLVANGVVGWRIPAERQLTPEAQQRRLQATEERLMAQMQQMEAQSLEQHRQEMALLNEMQAQADQVLNTVATAATSAAAATPVSSGPGFVPQDGGSVDHSTMTGSRTLTINDCPFTDGPQGLLGEGCGISDDAVEMCGPDYTCWAFGGGTAGVCVPSDQLEQCPR
jgi:hypothetical protein